MENKEFIWSVVSKCSLIPCEILKIPNGATVNYLDLEIESLTYNEDKESYNASIGRLKVLR